uniref:PPM-type phosphatase domain-containing protein n=1 Tax=Zooxanthella nutricula TaxID=1333877 RepID=A0A7S2M6P1_9DINO
MGCSMGSLQSEDVLSTPKASGNAGSGPSAGGAGFGQKLRRAPTLDQLLNSAGDASEDNDESLSADPCRVTPENSNATQSTPPLISVWASAAPAGRRLRRADSAQSFVEGDYSKPDPNTSQGIQAASIKGHKDSPNQDAWCVQRHTSGYSVYGVFDGHGPSGHDISNYVKERLPRLILEDERLGSPSMKAVVSEAFDKVATSLSEEGTAIAGKAAKSGTTATIVVHDHRKNMLTVSHVGDSGCAIASGKNYKAKYLTPDHKPNVSSEAKRIAKANGAVTFDGRSHRVHKKGGYGPMLNMSRTIGDLWGAGIGLTHEPDTLQVKVGSSDKLLVLCSDGVWEHLTAQKAVDVLKQALEAKASQTALTLARRASDMWEEAFENGSADDITVVVVMLQEQPRVGERRGSFDGSSDGEPPAGKPKLKRALSNLSASSAMSGTSTTSSQTAPAVKSGDKGRGILKRSASNVSAASCSSQDGKQLKSALKKRDNGGPGEESGGLVGPITTSMRRAATSTDSSKAGAVPRKSPSRDEERSIEAKEVDRAKCPSSQTRGVDAARLAELEQRKAQAVAEENFDLAKSLKQEIEAYRSGVDGVDLADDELFVVLREERDLSPKLEESQRRRSASRYFAMQ